MLDATHPAPAHNTLLPHFAHPTAAPPRLTRRALLHRLVLGGGGLAVVTGITTGMGILAVPTTARAAGRAGTARAAPAPITWDDLIPSDWQPMQSFQDMLHLFELPDSDLRVQQLYDKMRQVWDEAPTVPALAGRSVRLPGYVVPLESGKDGLREFLLVPYFGACIHTPPPPANQIIHVRSDTPVKGIKTMDAVWVSGVLDIDRRDNTDMGISGYAMSAQKIRKYTGAPQDPSGRTGGHR